MSGDYYESERGLSEYLLFHYGTAAEVLPWPAGPVNGLDYPARCVSECLDPATLPPSARALDLGCAVGRSTFELARHCLEVIGIDFSTHFIATARRLQASGSLPYAFTVEGNLTQPATAKVPVEIDRSRVRFEQGDAQQLRPDLGQFDVVLLANLIDRLNDPQRCLAQLAGLVKPGGQLIITSPYTWLEDYTPPTQWLGGCERDGQRLTTREGLQRALEPAFELTAVRDLPFLIREHARKYQWSVAEATHWRRRA